MSRGGDQSGLPKRRSGWLAPLVVFFVTACLSALVLAYYFAPGRGGLEEEQPAPTDATGTVAFAIGAVRLNVPANYIPFASARRGGAMNEVVLIAMLPEFRGYTLGAAQEFSANAADSRLVNFMLKAGQTLLPEQDRLERVYNAQTEDPAGRIGPYGLRQYGFRADSGYHDQDMFVGMGESGQVVLLCTKLSPDLPSPSCLRDLPLSGGITLSYRFKRAHLGQWRAIDSGTRGLIAGFMKAP